MTKRRPAPIESGKVLSVLLGCLVLVVATAGLAFVHRKCDDDGCKDFATWLNGDDVTTKSVLVGMASGVVFGFVDNTLLYTGITALDSVFERFPGSDDERVVAGLGNCFSSTVSAFVSTFIGRLIAEETGMKDGPMWAMAFGLFVGCLLGIIIPRVIIKAIS